MSLGNQKANSSLIEKNPKVFEPLLFASHDSMVSILILYTLPSNSVDWHVKNSKIMGTWEELNCGAIQLCITAKATYLYLLNKTGKMFNF